MSVLLSCAHQRGLTLYEMLVVLAIAGFVGMGLVGIPEWVERSRAVVRVNALVADLSLARSEAIKRRQAMVLCASTTGDTCTTGSAWGDGYIIFVDANGSEGREANETLVRVYGRETGLRLEYRGFRSHSYIVYQPSGIAANNGTFTVCPRKPTAGARTVVISATGRARIGTRTAAQAAAVCGRHNRS